MSGAFGGLAALFRVAATLTAETEVATPRRLFEMSRAELDAALGAVHRSHPSFDDRFKAVTRFSLGTPYYFGPLGEGPRGRWDKKPIINWRRVDCLTFVEQSMAFAWAPRFDEAVAVLQRIRYHNGQIDYSSRNHFTEAQWLPRNIAAGFLSDVTRTVAGDETKTLHKIVGNAAWKGRNRKWLVRVGADRLPRSYDVDYIPIDVAIRMVDKIPAGTVLSDIREDIPSTAVSVSHVGLVIDDGERKVFRHASGRGRFVEDTPLIRYLRYLRQSIKERQNGRPWRVLGINVARILPQS